MSGRGMVASLIASGVMLCGASAYLIKMESDTLSARSEAIQASSEALARHEYAKAIVLSRQFFSLTPRNPSIETEAKALDIYDAALTRWLAKNLQEDSEKVDQAVNGYEEIRRAVFARAQKERSPN